MAAPFDYTSIAATADSLLERFGVSVTLERDARTAAKPWEQAQGPSAAAAAESISGLSGVQINKRREPVPPGTTEQRFGLWVVQAGSALPEEIGIEWRLVAGSTTFEIEQVRPVQPGSLLLLYFVEVRL